MLCNLHIPIINIFKYLHLKCFSLYDINNEIDVQCIWSRDNIFFNAYEYNIGLLYYFLIVNQCKQYTGKKELILISTRYIVVAYIVIS